MTTSRTTTTGRGGRPTGGSPRRRAARGGAALAVPAIAYFAVRPWVSSDTVALAIAGALPLAYQIVLVALRRRVDPWALVSGIGFALGCLASLVSGGSSLPLKLHEAGVTFLAGLALLAAVLLRRPAPLGRLLRVPAADRRLDATLSAMVGGFFVLHSLLHVALAMMLSTAAYVVAGRLVNWATLALGAAGLYCYLRPVRRRTAESVRRDRSRESSR